MNLAARLKRPLIAFAATAFLGAAVTAHAQDVSESHLKAARSAIVALGTTQPFDNIILELASQLKSQLYQKNPDMQEVISNVVDETALELAGRRADLEREAALAYARVFTEEELTEIANFYSSPTGRKMMTDGPIVGRELLKAADIWRTGISRDLAQQVAEKLAAYARENPPQAPQTE